MSLENNLPHFSTRDPLSTSSLMNHQMENLSVNKPYQHSQVLVSHPSVWIIKESSSIKDGN